MSLHEIRGKIESVDGVSQITRAMEMVAGSKMRQAEERMAASRHYAGHMRKIIGHLARARPEYRHPWMRERTVAKVGYVVVSTDRGLCGGLNAALFRHTLAHMAEWHGRGTPIDVCTIGTKAQAMFRRTPCTMVAHAARLGDAPHVEQLIGAVSALLDDFGQGGIDRLFVAYNHFGGAMTQTPAIEQLLPLVPADDERLRHHWDYLYEPDARPMVALVLQRYVESQIYQAVVENLACEQAARMVAMRSATGNAEDLIDELRLDYNKSRQARITQELAEISGGARASGTGR